MTAVGGKFTLVAAMARKVIAANLMDRGEFLKTG
jgi:hypothetical protein